MQYDVVVGDRLRRVTVLRAGDAWQVTLDGVAFDVDAATVSGSTLSLLFAEHDGAPRVRSLRADVIPAGAPGAFDVHVNGHQVRLAVRESGASRRRVAADAIGAGPQRILATMPGKVVRVLVGVGDAVVSRQGVIVVEAMKMENELRAPKAGRVMSIAVVEGQSVDAGAVLAVVE